MKTKQCSHCHIKKLLNCFYKNSCRKDGYDNLCKECKKQYLSNYYLNNRHKILKRQKKYQKNNKKKITLYAKRWFKKWYKTHKDIRTKYHQKYSLTRYKKDINFRIVSNLRTRLTDALKKNIKSKRTLELLGCSVEFLKKHLESKFKDDMSWENHSFKGWHIDHILPCASFDLSNPEEQMKCFHWSNMQPLWARDNLKKNKY